MPTTFAGLPKGTQLRLAAIAVLKSAGTLAGPSVFDTRIDPIGPDAIPAIVVTSSEDRATISAAGGPPAFRVAYTLRLQGIVIAAEETDSVLQADTLRDQMLEALMGDPVWPGLVEAIGAATDTLWIGRTDARFERQTIISINTAFRQAYAPRATSVLLAGGQPATWRPVIAPLTEIANTVKPGPANSFGLTVALPPPA